VEIKNVFSIAGLDLHDEFFENILETQNFRVERIISRGHKSPENFWYDQETNEFVLLLKGEAELEFENKGKLKLKPGDYLIIKAHEKHRVAMTKNDGESFWITIHY
jgi:cupin 2 domain-containing protein